MIAHRPFLDRSHCVFRLTSVNDALRRELDLKRAGHRVAAARLARRKIKKPLDKPRQFC